MKMTWVKVVFATVIGAGVVCLIAKHLSAQKDPEAVQRQAQIDADLARLQIEELEREQAVAASVQDEYSVERLAREPRKDGLETEPVKSDRLMIEAEQAEQAD